MKQKNALAAIETAALQFLAGWNSGRSAMHSARWNAAVSLCTVQGRATRDAVAFAALQGTRGRR